MSQYACTYVSAYRVKDNTEHLSLSEKGALLAPCSLRLSLAGCSGLRVFVRAEGEGGKVGRWPERKKDNSKHDRVRLTREHQNHYQNDDDHP